MHKDVEKILVNEDEIINRCKELGKRISRDYDGKQPIFIGLLKGSVPFMAELIKNITIDMEMDFMDVSSYSGTERSDVRIIKDLETPVSDKNVIIVEDIVDTGKTCSKVRDLLIAKGAKEVKIVTMLDKKERRETDIEPDYVAFEIPDEFVIGFGLDYYELFRNLPYIGVLKQSAIK